MTTNLLGATVEISNGKTSMRGIVRGVEFQKFDELKIVVQREDGTLRVVEGTSTGRYKVRVVAEEKAEDPIRRVVRLGITESDEMVAALETLTPEDAEMFHKFRAGIAKSAHRPRVVVGGGPKPC